MRQNLTDRFCKSAKPEGGKRLKCKDENLNSWNLWLRVSATEKAWYCRYRFRNRRPGIGLGTYPSTSLAEARRKSLEIGSLVQNGIDPKAQARQASVRDLTVESAVEIYIERYCKEHQKSWKETERLFRNHVVPHLGNILLKDLSRADVINLMEVLARKGLTVQVNRVVTQIKAFFNWVVEDQEWVDLNPVATINRGKKKRFRETPRDRFLALDELKAIWRVSSGYSPIAGGYMRTLLLTGQRRDEVRLMAWSELNLETGEWLLPAERNKNKSAHLVFLPRRAIEEIHAIKAYKEELRIRVIELEQEIG